MSIPATSVSDLYLFYGMWKGRRQKAQLVYLHSVVQHAGNSSRIPFRFSPLSTSINESKRWRSGIVRTWCEIFPLFYITGSWLSSLIRPLPHFNSLAGLRITSFRRHCWRALEIYMDGVLPFLTKWEWRTKLCHFILMLFLVSEEG